MTLENDDVKFRGYVTSPADGKTYSIEIKDPNPSDPMAGDPMASDPMAGDGLVSDAPVGAPVGDLPAGDDGFPVRPAPMGGDLGAVDPTLGATGNPMISAEPPPDTPSIYFGDTNVALGQSVAPPIAEDHRYEKLQRVLGPRGADVGAAVTNLQGQYHKLAPYLMAAGSRAATAAGVGLSKAGVLADQVGQAIDIAKQPYRGGRPAPPRAVARKKSAREMEWEDKFLRIQGVFKGAGSRANPNAGMKTGGVAPPKVAVRRRR